MPILLSGGSKLGAINHALLSIGCLLEAGIRVLGYVLNEVYGSKGELLVNSEELQVDALESNREVIAEFATEYGVKEVGFLPYSEEVSRGAEFYPDYSSVFSVDFLSGIE